MEPQLTDGTKPPIEQSLGQDLEQSRWRGYSEEHGEENGEGEEHGRMHWGLMVLCCLPMIAVLLLVILGVWGTK